MPYATVQLGSRMREDKSHVAAQRRYSSGGAKISQKLIEIRLLGEFVRREPGRLP
jgi:hypothetical protein